MSYFLDWLGMKMFKLNTKDMLTICFTQCYLAAILRSASLPRKHSMIELVYWAEIAHFFLSGTRMVASFEIFAVPLQHALASGDEPRVEQIRELIRTRDGSGVFENFQVEDITLLLDYVSTY